MQEQGENTIRIEQTTHQRPVEQTSRAIGDPTKHAEHRSKSRCKEMSPKGMCGVTSICPIPKKMTLLCSGDYLVQNHFACISKWKIDWKEHAVCVGMFRGRCIWNAHFLSPMVWGGCWLRLPPADGDCRQVDWHLGYSRRLFLGHGEHCAHSAEQAVCWSLCWVCWVAWSSTGGGQDNCILAHG